MDANLTLLLTLILGHIVADFYLQPFSWVQARNTLHYKAKQLIAHSGIHGVISLGILIIWEMFFAWQDYAIAVYSAVIIAMTHYLIDLAKSYTRHGVVPFLVDQIAHLVVLLLIWIFWFDGDHHLAQWQASLFSYQSALLIFAYLIILNPASVFIRMLLQYWSNNFSPDDSLQSAGHHIGLLERFLMLTFLLLDQFSGVALIMAAKTVFRFGDLKQSSEKKLTEYVLLGSLISLAVTILVALTYKALS